MSAPAATASRRRAPAEWAGLHRPVLVAGGVASAFAVAYLLAPLTGLDLSAQIARADFARDHPLTPVDFRWFGGSLTFGYSLWTPFVLAWIGVRLTGSICAVAATVLTTLLFERTGARRPTLGGVLAALTQAINLFVGRFTFGVGEVVALGALLAACSTAHVLRTGPVLRAGVLSFVAGAASPVAALYLWLCAGALVLTGRLRVGAIIAVASAVPVILISAVFGDGGDQPYSGRDFRDALLASLVVLLVVPLRRMTLRVGAALALLMVLLAYVIDTPVGSNASRLSQLFAVPVVAAYVAWRPWLAALAIVAAGYPQQTVVQHWFTFGPATESGYYTPLVDELDARGGLTGRVEVPDTKAHWEAAFLARSVPLARGWTRQVDFGLNEHVFYDGPPTPDVYADWLALNAVQYVAVPDVPLSSFGTDEVSTIDGHPGYLRQVWHNDHWRLFQVMAPTPIVGAPGRLVAMDEAAVVLDTPAGSVVEVNLRWFDWLSLDGPGGCIAEAVGGRVQLRADEPGRYRLTSSLTPSGHC